MAVVRSPGSLTPLTKHRAADAWCDQRTGCHTPEEVEARLRELIADGNCLPMALVVGTVEAFRIAVERDHPSVLQAYVFDSGLIEHLAIGASSTRQTLKTPPEIAGVLEAAGWDLGSHERWYYELG